MKRALVDYPQNQRRVRHWGSILLILVCASGSVHYPSMSAHGVQRVFTAMSPRLSGDDSYYTQQAGLPDSSGQLLDRFGTSVALSGDGTTALVGAPGTPNSPGTVYVFVLSGASWTQQGALSASDGKGSNLFGQSVALSGDGNTALIGAPGSSSNTGAAYLFVRSGATWSQQAEMTANDAATSDQFGSSVALSGDGTTALVGAPDKNNGYGAAYWFVRTNTSWSQQSQVYAQASIEAGYAVALNGDGSTALIGAPAVLTGAGTAYVFVRTGTAWSNQTALLAGDHANLDHLGSSVALSESGDTALVGAPNKAANGLGNVGAAYAFVRSGTSWSQQQELANPDDSLGGLGAGGNEFGLSVALSGDGRTGLIGAPKAGAQNGAVYAFTWSSSSWSQQQALTPSCNVGGGCYSQWGFSVALNGDGNTALFGMGAMVYAHTPGSPNTPTPQPSATMTPTTISPSSTLIPSNTPADSTNTPAPVPSNAPAHSTSTPTSLPPSNTPVPPTDTTIPPTSTRVPPTNTAVPHPNAPTSAPLSAAPPVATATQPSPTATKPTAVTAARPTASIAGAGKSLILGSLPRSVASGSTLIVHLTAPPRRPVTVTLEVNERRTVTLGTGKKRHHAVRVVRLYYLITRGTTDAEGRLSARLRVAFHPRKPYQARLTVSVGGRRAAIMAATHLTITPPKTHRR
ncbi:MAG TPA: hypothetical protein VFE42_06135 [Chloroflexota bacterium]|nr:hypothetical protein [Chloroflexota bacterium]